MGWRLYEHVCEFSQAEDKGRLLLIEMAVVSDDSERTCHPGTDRLMRVSRASRSQVFRLLRKLQDAGEIEQTRSAHRGQAAEYRIVELDGLYGITPKGSRPDATQSEPERVAPRCDPIAVTNGSQKGRKRVASTRAGKPRLTNYDPPNPPQAGGASTPFPTPGSGRRRDRQRFDAEVEAFVRLQYPAVAAEAAARATRQAIDAGARDPEAVETFIERWWPQLLAA